MAVFRGTAVLLPADGVRLLLRPLLLRQERALLLAAGNEDNDPIGLVRLEYSIKIKTIIAILQHHIYLLASHLPSP